MLLLFCFAALCVSGVGAFTVPSMDEVHASMIAARDAHIQSNIDRVINELKNNRDNSFTIDLQVESDDCNTIAGALQHPKFEIKHKMFPKCINMNGTRCGAWDTHVQQVWTCKLDIKVTR